MNFYQNPLDDLKSFSKVVIENGKKVYQYRLKDYDKIEYLYNESDEIFNLNEVTPNV